MPAPGLPYGTPIPLDDSLLVLIEGGSIARIDAKEGRVLWSQSTEDEWSSFRPRLLDDRVLVGNAEGELMALGLEDGTTIETYRVEGAVRGSEFRRRALHRHAQRNAVRLLVRFERRPVQSERRLLLGQVQNGACRGG